MSWNHKGIEIELSGASFVAAVDGKRISASSLNGAKKAIDKHLQLKAQEVPIRLEVARIDEDGKVEHFVIVGIDPETLEPKWEGPTPRLYGGSFYPDDEESVRVYRAYKKAEAEYERARAALQARIVSTRFLDNRRYKTNYGQALEQLQKNYADAKSGKKG